jgi:hypothetical protein
MATREPMGTGGWSHELALFCPAFRFDSIFNTGYQARLNIKTSVLAVLGRSGEWETGWVTWTLDI